MLIRAVILPLALLATAACATTGNVQAPVVGGAQMYPSRSMLDNLRASGDHAGFVRAVDMAGLDETLAAPGPYTVLAASDTAFSGSKAQAEMDAGDKDGLAHFVNCNRIEGVTAVAQLSELAAAHGGHYILRTLGGCTLTATVAAEGGVTLTDENGVSGRITTGDISQVNGVVHVVDAVFLPKP